MISVEVTIEDDDRRHKALIKTLEEGAVFVDVGVHPVSGEEMVMIASTHEFGATIQNPGGQPFFITKDPKWKDVPNASPLKDGSTMVFVKKGKQGMGKTKPHTIDIPARPFVRSTADENSGRYTKKMQELLQKILDGKLSMSFALFQMGQKVESDIRRKIVQLKTPPNAPSTIRKKDGIDNPLVHTGTLTNSIRAVVKDARGNPTTIDDSRPTEF